MGRPSQLSFLQLALVFGLAFGCGSGKTPRQEQPYTGTPIGGGTPGAGGGSDGGVDSGFDSGLGFDAGGVCDAGCLGLGQVCDPLDVPNGGCVTGLSCRIDLNSGTTYTCQGNGGDF